MRSFFKQAASGKVGLADLREQASKLGQNVGKWAASTAGDEEHEGQRRRSSTDDGGESASLPSQLCICPSSATRPPRPSAANTFPGPAERPPMSLEEQAAKMKMIAQRYKVKFVAASKEMGVVKEENHKLHEEVRTAAEPLLDSTRPHCSGSRHRCLPVLTGPEPERLPDRDPQRRSREAEVRDLFTAPSAHPKPRSRASH